MDRKGSEKFFRLLLFRFLPLALLLSFVGWFVWARWRAERIPQNERMAYTLLKVLTGAEADFRANDRDRNEVQDFWTGDVAGLYSLMANGQEIQLIERALAEADLKPLNPLVPKPIPYHGYYFMALDRDESESPPEPYRQDTDKKSGKVHHARKFGFCAIPAEYKVTGRGFFIVNENNTVRFKYTYTEGVDSWPSDEDMRHEWAIGG
jgi:hypothetical protein